MAGPGSGASGYYMDPGETESVTHHTSQRENIREGAGHDTISGHNHDMSRSGDTMNE